MVESCPHASAAVALFSMEKIERGLAECVSMYMVMHYAWLWGNHERRRPSDTTPRRDLFIVFPCIEMLFDKSARERNVFTVFDALEDPPGWFTKYGLTRPSPREAYVIIYVSDVGMFKVCKIHEDPATFIKASQRPIFESDVRNMVTRFLDGGGFVLVDDPTSFSIAYMACATCGMRIEHTKTRRMCTRCMSTVYCSRACQHANYTDHKSLCL